MWWKGLLILLAAVNLAYGVFAAIFPDRAAELVDYKLLSAAARGETRAVYGGLLFVIGLVILQALRHGRAAWLQVAGYGFFGLAAGHAISLVADGFSWHTLVAFVFEAGSGWLLAYGGSQLATRRA